MTTFEDLADELRDSKAELLKRGKGVVAKGCLNIKNDTKAGWQGLNHARSLPAAVSYDVDVIGSLIAGEVGPDKNRPQGALGNLIEFGSVNNGPIPSLTPAFRREEPRFIAAVEGLIDEVLW